MLKVESLTKEFTSDAEVVRAVDGLDLEVAQGEWVTLLGPSGCGKTTTLRCVAGLESPTGGSISIGGDTVYSASGRNLSADKRPISMVFQSYAIWPHMSVRANVAFPLTIRRSMSKEEVADRVGNALRLTDIEQLAERDATRLSGGQQQRVALARAIVKEHKLLLLDEPLSNLDARLRIEMRKELKELRARLAITTLHVTHDQEEALSLSDRIVVMNKGKIVEIDTPERLFHSPSTAFAAAFLGNAELWDVAEWSRTTDGADVSTPYGVFRCDNVNAPTGTPAKLMIRQEHIEVQSWDSASGSDGIIAGTIASVMFYGSRIELAVDTDAGQIRVERSSTEGPSVGDKVALSIPANRCVLVQA